MKIVEFKDYDNQTTPLSAYNLNRLQQNLITTKYQMTFSSAVSGGSTITLPCYYQVGQDTLDVYLNSELLKKASTKDSEGHYYEVGNSDTKSNQIKITSDWSIASGDVLNLIVRGTTDSYDQNLSPDKATQLADEINANKEEITALQTENSRLKGITNALPKISGEDTSLTLTNTANAPLSDIILKGNTSQDGEPTPDTPIPVNVVTGDNSITISNNDNTQSQTYPINLGSMELCKIGDYQDYFYKSGSKWYLHKEVDKDIVDKNNTIAITNPNTSNWYYRITPKKITSTASQTNQICNYYPNREVFNGNTMQGILKISNGDQIRIRYGTEDTVANFKTWLASNNIILYSLLATATNTEITDTTLISQLNALYNAYTYNDTTNISQTNANLPFIINAEAFKKIS